MNRTGLCVLAIACAAAPAIVVAQSPKAATYITDEEVKKVNALPEGPLAPPPEPAAA